MRDAFNKHMATIGRKCGDQSGDQSDDQSDDLFTSNPTLDVSSFDAPSTTVTLSNGTVVTTMSNGSTITTLPNGAQTWVSTAQPVYTPAELTMEAFCDDASIPTCDNGSEPNSKGVCKDGSTPICQDGNQARFPGMSGLGFAWETAGPAIASAIIPGIASIFGGGNKDAEKAAKIQAKALKQQELMQARLQAEAEQQSAAQTKYLVVGGIALATLVLGGLLLYKGKGKKK